MKDIKCQIQIKPFDDDFRFFCRCVIFQNVFFCACNVVGDVLSPIDITHVKVEGLAIFWRHQFQQADSIIANKSPLSNRVEIKTGHRFVGFAVEANLINKEKYKNPFL